MNFNFETNAIEMKRCEIKQNAKFLCSRIVGFLYHFEEFAIKKNEYK